MKQKGKKIKLLRLLPVLFVFIFSCSLLGQPAVMEGKIALAEGNYQEALKLFMSDSTIIDELHKPIVLCYFNLNLFNDAEFHLKKAIEINNSDIGLYLFMGKVKKTTGKTAMLRYGMKKL